MLLVRIRELQQQINSGIHDKEFTKTLQNELNKLLNIKSTYYNMKNITDKDRIKDY